MAIRHSFGSSLDARFDGRFNAYLIAHGQTDQVPVSRSPLPPGRSQSVTAPLRNAPFGPSANIAIVVDEALLRR